MENKKGKKERKVKKEDVRTYVNHVRNICQCRIG